ncbi:dermonecrotic toxin domain-containing protein [Pseudomonas kitaguniensis]|uniref:dermonecrotic toxin domain-containing protein n=1 Tax=Pseudomonas kitaguniensis TaxID=2607908 RepID=UPI003D08338E
MTTLPAPAPEDKGQHYALIRDALPDWVKTLPMSRVSALKASPKNIQAWYKSASFDQHQRLKTAITEHWKTQSLIDQKLAPVTDLKAYAEPLLKAALKQHYNLDVDVRSTCLRLYAPAEQPWWVIDLSGGVRSRTVSLLDAALHNFAHSESFSADSQFITQPDALGHFDVLPLKSTLSIEQFVTLVRTLDIGAQYHKHLELYLGLNQPVVHGVLRARVNANQQAALKVAAHMALMKGDIQPADLRLITDLIAGRQLLTLDAKPVHCHDLSLMDATLTGVVLIGANLEQSREAVPVIVYLPDDPQHPLKRYASTVEFMLELTGKLREPDYQRFFSRFIEHQYLGHFFGQLGARLSQVKWHQHVPGEAQPSWRDTALDTPNLQFSVQRVPTPVWQHLYQRKVDKTLNDARELAIATAYADRMARWAWWDNLQKVFADLLNAALLVVTPFVPFLGELMLAYTAYQIADEVFEGLLDWAQGQGIEAIEHVVAVTENLLQLIAFGAAAQLAQVKLSPFVEGLQPVTRSDGALRLWQADLSPYEQKTVVLAAESQPDTHGFHQHDGKKILRVAQKHYEVSQDPDTGAHRIVHPLRAHAYRPEVLLNGRGAVVLQGEEPRAWDDTQLFQRLSPATATWPAERLQQLRAISGTEPGALRHMYSENQAPPPLLADTLDRFELRQHIDTLSEPFADTEEAVYWSADMVTRMPGWPSAKAIEVFEAADLSGASIRHGALEAPSDQTLAICSDDLMAGQLAQRLVGFLDETELADLLGKPLPAEHGARTQALREQLSAYIASRKDEIFEHLYRFKLQSNSAHGLLLQQRFPDLPDSLGRAILAQARPAEVHIMNEEQRVPLRLSHQARELQFEALSTHAYEGFYQGDAPTPVTERLLLNALRLHSDAFGNLRISIREQLPTGQLRCRVGPDAATTETLLIRTAPGRYTLHGAGTDSTFDLYEAVLQAIPRDTLGFAPGQGAGLREWLQQTLQPPAERRTALAEGPTLAVASRDTQQLLQTPLFSALRRRLGLNSPNVEERLKALYPSLSAADVTAYAEALDSSAGQRVLRALETQKKTLLTELNNWQKLPAAGSQRRRPALPEQLFRKRLIQLIQEGWEQSAQGYETEVGTRQLGSELDLRGETIYGFLQHFPALSDRLQHVTSLNLAGTQFTLADSAFLHNFPNLRTLDITGKRLTELPGAIAGMRRLTQLGLAENPIRWAAHSLEQLKHLQHLRVLILSHNEYLLTPPDISRMPELQILMLNNTPISQWPVGLADLPRSPHFNLSLLNTAITQVPIVEPGSASAELIARTRLNRNKLEPNAENRLVSYRRAAGLDPYRTYPPRGEQDSQYWLGHLPAEQRVGWQSVWNDLEREHGSQGFFEVIKSQQQPEFLVVQDPADVLRYGRNLSQLRINVLRLLRAADCDELTRSALFNLAAAPAQCADAGAHLFNAMGIETMKLEAWHEPTRQTRTNALVQLAKQKARLDKLNQIANLDIQARLVTPTRNEDGSEGPPLRLTTDIVGGVSGTLDEVEVYSAYQTGLKARLDLPWLADHMLYRDSGEVEAAQLVSAYNQVIESEQGDGLVDQMLEQYFWSEYLRETHRDEYQKINCQHAQASDTIDDLRLAQNAWATDQQLPAEQREPTASAQLRQRLVELADRLKVNHEHVLTTEPMSEELYLSLFLKSFYDEKELGRSLTRLAMIEAQV